MGWLDDVWGGVKKAGEYGLGASTYGLVGKNPYAAAINTAGEELGAGSGLGDTLYNFGTQDSGTIPGVSGILGGGKADDPGLAGPIDPDVAAYVYGDAGYGGGPDYADRRTSTYHTRAQDMLFKPSRYQPGIDTAGMYQAGAAGQIAGVGGQLGGVAGQVGGAAQGAGYQGQMAAAQGLYGLGMAQQGPSAAEMAMRAHAGQALQGQAAMAASQRGANAGLAMQNAAAGNATLQGDLVAQLGQQRAAEDLAYRQQRMAALGAAGQTYQGALGSQLSAYGQQANVLGGQAQVYGGAGQMAGEAGKMALSGSQLELARDEAARAYYGMGDEQQRIKMGARMAYDQSRTGNVLQKYGADRGMALQNDAQQAARTGSYLSASGTVLGGVFGGPGGAAVGSQVGAGLGGAFRR